MAKRVRLFGNVHAPAGMARPIDLDPWALHSVIHLVAKHPDLATRAGGHKVRNAAGILLVEAAVGDCAVGFVAMIDAADHTQSQIAKGTKIYTTTIVWIAPNRHIKDHPTRATGSQHMLFAAWFMNAKDIFRIEKWPQISLQQVSL